MNEPTVAGPGAIVTPGTILDYMREVNRMVDEINVGVHSTQPPPDLALHQNWLKFWLDWKKFFDEHQGFTDRLSGSVADTVERYETDAAEWRKKLTAAGFKLSAVTYQPNKEPGGPALPNNWPWGKIAIGVGACLALYVVVKST